MRADALKLISRTPGALHDKGSLLNGCCGRIVTWNMRDVQHTRQMKALRQVPIAQVHAAQPVFMIDKDVDVSTHHCQRSRWIYASYDAVVNPFQPYNLIVAFQLFAEASANFLLSIFATAKIYAFYAA